MKLRMFCLLLCLLLTLTACAVGAQESEAQGCFLYYPTRDYEPQGALTAQNTALQPRQLSPEEFLSHYLSAEPPAEALPTLPEGWSLDSCLLQDSALLLKFQGAPTSPERLSLTLACLTQTLLQHPLLATVSYTVPGEESPYVLSAKDFVLSDTGMLPQEELVTIYFPDAKKRYLSPEAWSMNAQQRENKAQFILETLLSQGETSCIPQGTRLLSVHTENGLCTVNFSSEFERNMEKSYTAERLAVYSVVNSLTELPEISTVDFCVAGAPLERLSFLDLRQGVIRDESLLAAANTSAMKDLTLYGAHSGGLLVPVPVMIGGETEDALAEALLQRLLDYRCSDGPVTCIPQGTKLLSLRIENRLCTVDLTGEFLNGCTTQQEELYAIRAMIATLCQIEGISGVELLVEGISPDFLDESLLQLRSPVQSWLAR